MPIAQEFEYCKPKDAAEAVRVLSGYKGKARVLAGGTDLLVWLKEGLISPEGVVDIKGIPELDRLKLKGSSLSIGATVTFTRLIESKDVERKLPLLWESARTVASVGVRNRATLVGNICSAVPSLDSGPALLAYGATVLVRGTHGKRKTAIEDWFTGPKKTAFRAGGLVTDVVVKVPRKKHGACYVKLGRYRGEDLAQVGVGVLALPDRTYRVAFCAVGPVPSRAKRIEALLKGGRLSGPLIKKAQALVPKEISPITDIRGSKEYRLHMAKVMLERGLKTAADRLVGKGPAYGTSVI